MESIPIEILMEIFSNLKLELLTCRLVNRKWNVAAFAELKNFKLKPITFISTKEVEYFTHLFGDHYPLPTFLSSFVFTTSQLRIDILSSFGAQIGHHVQKYHFMEENNNPNPVPVVGLKIFSLLQKSPNIHKLKIDGKCSLGMEDSEKNQKLITNLPTFPNLNHIEYRESGSLIEVIKRAPNLKKLVITVDTNEGLQNFGRIFELLPQNTRVDATFLHMSWYGDIDVLGRVSQLQARMTRLKLGIGIEGVEWPNLITNLISSQAGTLQYISIDQGRKYRIPPLPFIETLDISVTNATASDELLPNMFPSLRNLTIDWSDTFVLFKGHVWPTIEHFHYSDLKGFGMAQRQRIITPEITTIFPNLTTLTLVTRTLKEDLKCVLQTCWKLAELHLCFASSCYQDRFGDLWEEIAGNAERIPEDVLLGETFSLEAHGAGRGVDTFQKMKSLKKFRVDNCLLVTLQAIVYATRMGDFRLDSLDLTYDFKFEGRRKEIYLNVLRAYHKHVLLTEKEPSPRINLPQPMH